MRSRRRRPGTHAYFKHAGALLTADCTDDELIKLEGVPKGEEFSF